jgi:hypothetical protein
LFSGRDVVHLRVPEIGVDSNICHDDVIRLQFVGDPPTGITIDQSKVADYEVQGEVAPSMRGITAEEFEEIKRTAEENGRLGEEHVLAHEITRLTRLRRGDLAKKVRLVSSTNVAAGYDILSYEGDGRKRYIEVKATSGDGMSFYMTRNEWKRAQKLKDASYVYRVINVRSSPTIAQQFTNPAALEAEGKLRLTPIGWWIKVMPH